MRSIGLLLLALVVIACDGSSPQRTRVAIWVTPGSRADALHFGVSRDSGATASVRVQGVAVSICGGAAEVVWRVMLDSIVEPAPSEFTYGVDEAGYTADVAPRPIGRGCYRARVIGASGIVTFSVDSLGNVTQNSMSY